MIRKSYVDTSTGQMHIRSCGAGSQRPLLCFHMSPFSGVVFERFMKAAGRERQVIAPDTPGFGMSDTPATMPEIADYARAMGELADALQIDEFDVVGIHTGSKIAAELGLQRPRQVRHIIMVAAPIFTDEELAQFRSLYAPKIPTRDGSHITTHWQLMCEVAGPGQTLDLLAESWFEAFRNLPTSWWGHRAAFNYPLANTLSRLDPPVLILNANDDLTQQTRRAASYLKNGRILDLPEWGNGFFDVHTKEVVKLVREFTS